MKDDAPVTNGGITDSAVKRVDYRCPNFSHLYNQLGGFRSGRDFARWLDEHGYKTFPDMPDYIS